MVTDVYQLLFRHETKTLYLVYVIIFHDSIFFNAKFCFTESVRAGLESNLPQRNSGFFDRKFSHKTRNSSSESKF